MVKIDKVFHELIRVAIGTQDTLSQQPSNNEWKVLYEMAQKQSIVGICFAGLQHLGADADEGFVRIGMSEDLYFHWIGMAATIQKKNEIVNSHCIELQAKISADGIASRILKGQGVGQIYPEHIRGLRQSGDIDLWMILPKEKVVDWANAHGKTNHASYLHVGCHIFDDTEVELHYRPTYMRSLRYNKRMQKFCEIHSNAYQIRNGIVVPSIDFDIVYQLSHMYRHLFGTGVGLRQLMDYLFVLKTQAQRTECIDIKETLKHLGLYNFACAVMYVLQEVFCLEEQYMICPVDERRGRMLLRQVMQTGNFGKMDSEQKEARSTTMGNVKYKLSQWWELMSFYPEETLSAPIWTLVRKLKDQETKVQYRHL